MKNACLGCGAVPTAKDQWPRELCLSCDQQFYPEHHFPGVKPPLQLVSQRSRMRLVGSKLPPSRRELADVLHDLGRALGDKAFGDELLCSTLQETCARTQALFAELGRLGLCLQEYERTVRNHVPIALTG